MRITTLAIALAGATTALPAAAADVFGHWLTENQKAIVEITPCGQSACGNIVWMAEPNGPDGLPKTDKNNPDASLASRTICNMAMIGDFTNDGNGEWSNGFIYDPEGGDVYKSKMRLTEEGNLYVRGYVGIPLLGKSQVWTRETGSRTGC